MDTKYPPFYDKRDFKSFGAWATLDDGLRVWMYEHFQKKIKNVEARRAEARELRRKVLAEREADKIKFDAALAV